MGSYLGDLLWGLLGGLLGGVLGGVLGDLLWGVLGDLLWGVLGDLLWGVLGDIPRRTMTYNDLFGVVLGSLLGVVGYKTNYTRTDGWKPSIKKSVQPNSQNHSSTAKSAKSEVSRNATSAERRVITTN